MWAGAEEPSSAPGGRKANLAASFIVTLTGKIGLAWVADGAGDLQTTFGPEDVFHYIYGIFHAPEYRSRYAEFLKIDFPRVPLTSDPDLFRALCRLGARLVSLHLLECVGDALPTFPIAGNNVVAPPRYTAPGNSWDEGRVWINPTQYFAGVAPEVWDFHVGGYQVCQKWLKDRKERALDA